MTADLHCHSRISDGSLSIRELVSLAKRIGINVLAIADHDTVEGLKEAAEECQNQGIRNISAVEISAYDHKRNRKAHILGYLLDRPEEVGQICSPMLDQRQEVSKWIVDTLIDMGYPITWELTEKLSSGSTNVYKQHIMHALMELGYAFSIHDELYVKLLATPKDGNPCGVAYREIEYINVIEAVQAVKRAGGVAILAHPAGYKNMDLIPELVSIGLDGLEAWHPSQNEADEKAIKELAERYKLIVTGGSDFHGMYEGRANPLGCCRTPEEYLEALYLRKGRCK